MSEQKNDNTAWLEENIAEARSVTWTKTEAPSRFDEDDPNSDHSHCIICWKAVSQQTTPVVYESSLGWLCTECHEKHLKV